MKNVLVLISSARHPALNDGAVANAIDVLRAQDATVGRPDWLARDIACEIPFDGAASPPAMTALDAVIVPAEGRRKRLLVADMEATIIRNEMLEELADFLGLREPVADITARAMNGEIDFAGALVERVRLLKGLEVTKLDEAARRIRYTQGAATLVATMQHHGARCLLVSGGFTYFTALVAKALGFDGASANVLEHDGGRLAGTVAAPILGREAKLETLRRVSAEIGIEPSQSLSVGDGANDLPMLQAAGLGVAFHAKPAVAAAVSARLDHGDLTGLLYLQGYRRSDFVERTDP